MTPRNILPRAAGYLLALTAIVLVFGCADSKPPPQAQVKAAFWPPYPDEPHIQYLVSYRSSKDIVPQKSKLDELVMGKEQEESLDLNKPYGVDMYQGKIYVCDLRRNNVTVLDLRRHVTLVLGQSGSEHLEQPSDITISPEGIKYVSDVGRGLIFVFDQNEKMIGTIGHKDLKPAAVAVHDNLLYVSDFAGQRVEVYDRTNGQLLRTIGKPGQGPGQFTRPLGIAVDKNGFVYVADVMNCKLQKFDPAGKLVTSFSDISPTAGGLVRPKHIAVDQEGIIYVVDAAFQNVQLFDQLGHVYTYFGTAGAHPGAMFLPAGICVHEGDLDLFAQYIHPAFEAQRLVVVTNQFGDNKISVYALGHLKAGKTLADISESRGLVPMGTGDNPKMRGITSPLTPTTEPAALPSAPTTAPAANP